MFAILVFGYMAVGFVAFGIGLGVKAEPEHCVFGSVFWPVTILILLGVRIGQIAAD